MKRTRGARTLAALTLVVGAASAIAAGPARASLLVRYSYESNVANAKLGGSVAAVGDLNGDGYGDIAASAAGGAYAFYGSASGPFTSTPWTSVGHGATPAAVGDVNGDGFAVGVPGSGQVLVFYGSGSGLPSTPSLTLTGAAGFGGAVAAAGDVNGDGYADLLVGSPTAGSNAGRADLFVGSGSGLNTTAAWTQAGGAGSQFGFAFAGGGDVDADGYSDFLVCASGGGGAGSLDLYRGSAAGPVVMSGLAGAASTTAFTDVNGDGFSDIAWGFPGRPFTSDLGQMELWRWRLLGRAHAPQQLRGDGSAPVDLLGSSGANAFRIQARAPGPVGRSKVRLEYQVRAGSGAWGALQRGAWFDSGSPTGSDHGARLLVAQISSLTASALYGWRARVASSGPDIYRESQWLAEPGNAWTQPDLRTGSTVLAATSAPFVPGRLLASVRPNPTLSLARLTLRLPGSQAVAIDVLDIRGRRVRHIESASGGAASRDLTWDLRDAQGRPVDPGVYLVHAVAGAESDMRRIVVLR